MKRLAFVMAALLMLSLVLTACGGDTSGSGASGTGGNGGGSSGQELTVQIGSNPETIDPALNQTADAASMILHSFECLLIRNDDESLSPGQAAAMPEVSEDETTYTFTLREGLKWSDGEPLTAGDFEYAWKRAVAADTAAPYAEMFMVIDGYDEAHAGDGSALNVTALDDLTLEVVLAAPCAYFLDLAAFPTYSPLRQDIVEEHGESWAINAETYITNGAFHVTEWVPSEYITMEKNPNYWNAEAITLDKLTFLLLEDGNATLNAYQTGQAQLVKDLPANEVATLSQQDDYHLDPLQGTYYLSFNTQKEPYNDPKVRMALSLAIDREFMANTVMQGTYTPAGNLVGPGITDVPGKEFYDESVAMNDGPFFSIDDYESDLEQAKALLAEAGYPNGEGFPKITYSTNDAAFHKPVAEALQDMWSELGVEMEIDIMEWSVFPSARRNGDFEIARNGWVNDYNDPSTLLELLYTTNGNNDGKYTNAEFDTLMDEVRVTTDAEERMSKMHEAEKILMDEAACAPVAYYAEFYLLDPKVEGFYHSSLGYFYFHYVTIAE